MTVPPVVHLLAMWTTGEHLARRKINGLRIKTTWMGTPGSLADDDPDFNWIGIWGFWIHHGHSRAQFYKMGPAHPTCLGRD